MDIDLNSKNSKGLTSSKLLSEEDPTLMETLFLEKLENLTKMKNEENFFMFEKNNKYFASFENFDFNKLKEMYLFKNFGNKNEIIKKNLERYVNEPNESEKINFNDIEYKILLLNLKLKSMFDVESVALSNYNMENFFNKQHVDSLDKFMFENILLERI